MRRLIALVCLVFGLSSSPLAANIVVVVGPESPVQELSQREVANIFLSKTNRYDDGSRVNSLELSDDSVKARFYRLISGKTLPQINSYWTTLIFTGRGKPPVSRDTPDEIVHKLLDDPQAISYLPQDKVPKTLRIVFRPE